MLLIWGTKKTERVLGFVAEYCPRCQEIRRVRIKRLGMAGHLFFVAMGKGESLGYVAECQQCNGIFSVNPFEYVLFEKSNKLDIETLTNRTNPRLRSGGEMDPNFIRESKIYNPFLRFSQSLSDRARDGSKLDWKGVLALFLSVAIPIALGMLASSFTDDAIVKDKIAIFCFCLFFIGLIAAIVYVTLEPKRFFQKNIHPLIVHDLISVSATKQELVKVFESLKKFEYKIVEFVDIERLASDLSTQKRP